MSSLEQLHLEIVECTRCPRLRRYCNKVADVKRKSFEHQEYWRRPVPGFGDPKARLWIVGLAPAAHGGNRTGRVFTGDFSGNFLYAALHRSGFASQPDSTWRDDGMTLFDCYISASCRCAPPDNKPTPIELKRCSRFLIGEWNLLERRRVILALGKIAWDQTTCLIDSFGVEKIRTSFGHGAQIDFLQLGLSLVGSYHVSPRNTFTGRLTPTMFDDVLTRCRDIIST